jgi:SAM-dependent methyltransferase
VAVPRSTIPAVTHVDYSARLQTIDARHGRFRRLLEAFHARTGCPVLANTSFNLSWEPIVLTPAEAYQTFMQSEMDLLVLGDHVLHKSQQCLGFDGPDASPWVAARTESRKLASSDPVAPVRDLLESGRKIDLLRRLNDDLPYSARIVEFGCGPGTTAAFLSVAHRQVLGIDADPAAIAEAHRLRDTYGLSRASFHEAPLASPGFRTGHFDFALALDPPAMAGHESVIVEAMSACLRPGGWLVLAMGSRPIRPLVPEIGGKERLFPRGEDILGTGAWCRLLRGQGLTPIAFEPSPRLWAGIEAGPLFRPDRRPAITNSDSMWASFERFTRPLVLLARKEP